MFRRSNNKYGAVKTVVDGHVFDSKAEAAYYKQLKHTGASFMIHERFAIIDKYTLGKRSHRAAVYTPDFAFYRDGVLVSVVDVKGGQATMTADANLRMKAFESRYKVPVIIARLVRGKFEEEQF